MPAPAAAVACKLVAVGFAAIASSYVFIKYVYEPHIAPALERMAEDFLERRRAASNGGRRLASPVEASPGHDDIQLNETRARSRNNREEEVVEREQIQGEERTPLLPGDARPNASGRDWDPQTTLRRRPVGPNSPTSPANPVNPVNPVSPPRLVHPVRPRRGRGTHTNVSASQITTTTNTTAPATPGVPVVPVVYAVPIVPAAAALDPLAANGPYTPPDVDEWRKKVVSASTKRRDPRLLESSSPSQPSTSSAATVHPLRPGPPGVQNVHMLDEPNHPLPQTPIYPTHVITDSSVPSTPTSTTSRLERPSQTTPLRNRDSMVSDISIVTHDGAESTNTDPFGEPENPWIRTFSPTRGDHSVHSIGSQSPPPRQLLPPVSVLSVHANLTNGEKRPLPASPVRSLGMSPPPMSSSRASSVESTLQRPPIPPPSPKSPPKTPSSPPYLLTPSAQHPHHVHLPAPPNISSSSSAAAFHPKSASNPNLPPSAASPILSLSQTYPVSLEQEHGIEIVSNPSSTASSNFSSPHLSSPHLSSPHLSSPDFMSPFIRPASSASSAEQLVHGEEDAGREFEFDTEYVAEMLGVAGTPNTVEQRRRAYMNGPTRTPGGTLGSPSISLSPPVSGTTGLGIGGTASNGVEPSSVTTLRQSVFDDAMRARDAGTRSPPSPSSPGMFYSFTEDGQPQHSTGRSSILSFPDVTRPQATQQRFASPGIMSPQLSELEFVSDYAASDDGSHFSSNDEVRSESSWASARF